MHPDVIRDVKNDARETLTRNVKEAAKLLKLLTRFGVDLPSKKIEGIKLLRETLGLDLRDAKDAWELAYELRAA